MLYKDLDRIMGDIFLEMPCYSKVCCGFDNQIARANKSFQYSIGNQEVGKIFKINVQFDIYLYDVMKLNALGGYVGSKNNCKSIIAKNKEKEGDVDNVA